MVKPRVLSIATAILSAQTLAFAAYAADQTPATPAAAQDRSMPAHAVGKSVSPKDFASQAATISKAEIELGELALKLSKNEEVKKFAKRMVTDHTASTAKLKTATSKENITLPQSLDAEHQATKEKLASLEGEAFDREYAEAMAKGHDKAVALFESASQTQQLPGDLKQFAASTLPTLREHQKMAHSLHGKAN
jgi:putative membrane protein